MEVRLLRLGLCSIAWAPLPAAAPGSRFMEIAERPSNTSLVHHVACGVVEGLLRGGRVVRVGVLCVDAAHDFADGGGLRRLRLFESLVGRTLVLYVGSSVSSTAHVHVVQPAGQVSDIFLHLLHSGHLLIEGEACGVGCAPVAARVSQGAGFEAQSCRRVLDRSLLARAEGTHDALSVWLYGLGVPISLYTWRHFDVVERNFLGLIELTSGAFRGDIEASRARG